jgi:7-cyano-7-deazaguanine reductase
MTELHAGIKKLGETETNYKYDAPDKSLLEAFPSPFYLNETNPNSVGGSLNIVCPEFTSLCPKTGQPDFATIIIDYVPDTKCVESKSLKLYLGSFRNHGEFHESCICRITNDLVELLNPLWIKVTGQFTPRGGIPFWPTCEWDSATHNGGSK